MSTATLEAPATTATPNLDTSSVQQAAEAAELALREEAKGTLTACVHAFRRGERALTAGMLESGRLAHLYICQRLALKDTRANAVKVLEGKLAEYASDAVDVSRMIRAHYSSVLLLTAAGMDKQPHVAYSHYRDHYCRLVTPTNPNTATEQWVLLPGVEAECGELYKQCVVAGLPRESVGEQVAGLVRKHAGLADAAAAADKARKLAESQAAETAAKLANAEREAADLQAKAAEQAAKDTADEAKRAELTAVAEQAKQELEAKNRAAIEANNVASLAAKDAHNASKAADKAATVNAKLNAVPRERGPAREAATPPSDTSKQGTNLLASAKAGTPRDAGEMAASIVAACQDPATALEEFCKALCKHSNVANATKRHVNGLLVMLRRVEPSVPAPAESAN